MTNTNRDALVDTYINAMIAKMSLKEMQEMLYTMVESDLEDISDEQLIREIEFTCPEVL